MEHKTISLADQVFEKLENDIGLRHKVAVHIVPKG